MELHQLMDGSEVETGIQTWRIEISNTDGTHHSFVPRFRGDIEPERALEFLNITLDHSRFVALVSWP